MTYLKRTKRKLYNEMKRLFVIGIIGFGISLAVDIVAFIIFWRLTIKMDILEVVCLYLFSLCFLQLLPFSFVIEYVSQKAKRKINTAVDEVSKYSKQSCNNAVNFQKETIADDRSIK